MTQNGILKDDVIDMERAFFECIEKGDCDALIKYLSNGIKPEVRNSIGWTALMVAVTFNQLKIAQLLLDKGADVNAQSFSGLTPLKMANYAKNNAIINLLKSAGAND